MDYERSVAMADLLINVGSRKSQLALIQTNSIIAKLDQFYCNNPDKLEQICSRYSKGSHKLEFNVVAMSTVGDKVLDMPLPEIGAKSLFTKELEIALVKHEIDFVVHSLKDLPTTLPEGCVVGAVIKRDCPEDTIVLKQGLSGVGPLELLSGKYVQSDRKIKIGTSSHRRISMIKRCNPEIECIDIRGNLNTRFAKLDHDDSPYDAIVLAKAGLDRMDWSSRSSCLLDPDSDELLTHWMYAVGQGAIAVECRAEDTFILDLLSPIIDIPTTYEVVAERSLMKRLEGGCSVPLGVRSSWLDPSNLHLTAIVLDLEGVQTVTSKGNTCLSMSNEEVQQPVGLYTGITVPISIAGISHNLRACQELGVRVAEEMIQLGCLKLMNRDKYSS